MKEFIIRDGKKLRLGYTTGSCAAAAAKAAAWMLLSGSKKESIRLLTPKGMELTLAVEDICLSPDCVRCAIRKDSGDDPDITRDTLIYAEVRKTETVGIVIDGGQGVGRVTKPGLDQPVGAAAINSVPRLMIREAVEEVCGLFGYTGGMYVVISAPDGETLAKKTFNPRLGIEGGISILGTTGIVEPMSEQALVDTIHVELRQRREGGADYVLLAPGNYGVDYIKGAMGIDPATAVMTSNFIGDALEMCRELGFRGVLLIGHIGKLVKLAGGMWNTHSRYGDCRMDILTACAAAEGLHGGAAAEMLCCATCDDALRLLKEQGLYDAVLHRLAGRIDDDAAPINAVIWRRALSCFPRNTAISVRRRAHRQAAAPDKGGVTMVHFVGAGSGAADLITVRGAKLLGEADVVIYAGLTGESGAAGLHQGGLRDPRQRQADAGGGHRPHRESGGGGKDHGASAHGGFQHLWCGAGAVRRAGKAGHRLRRLPRRQRLLRRSVRAAGGVHPARCEPDRHHHPRPGPHPGAGAGVHPLAGGPSGHHGAVSQHLADRTAASRAAGGRLCR